MVVKQQILVTERGSVTSKLMPLGREHILHGDGGRPTFSRAET